MNAKIHRFEVIEEMDGSVTLQFIGNAPTESWERVAIACAMETMAEQLRQPSLFSVRRH